MNHIKEDFEKKVYEIDHYFRFLYKIVEENAFLFFEEKHTHKKQKITETLHKTLKANVFLLLYNLIESAVSLSLQHIYDTVTVSSIRYKDLKGEFQKIWLKEHHKKFKDYSIDDLHEAIAGSVLDEVFNLSFDSDKVISGNIDGQKIRAFGEKFGFSTRTHYTSNRGSRLHLVKTKRNDLAHGNISFQECGRDYTFQDLEAIKKETISYLRRIMKNIELFIDQEEFKANV